MNETMISFQGWVGTEVTERYAGQVPVATFRVASTPRRYAAKHNGWVDGETNWYTVNAWRALGRNCLRSIEQGQAVVVHGKLTTSVWHDDAGNAHQTMVVEATSVGHDLTKGTSEFTKTTSGEDGDDSDLRQHNAALGVGGPQISSDGKAIGDLVGSSSGATRSEAADADDAEAEHVA